MRIDAATASRLPRIRLEFDRAIAPLDHDSPPSGSVTARQRVASALVDMLATGWAIPDDRLDGLGGIDVGDRLPAGSAHTADVEHGRHQARVTVSLKPVINPPTCLGSIVIVPSSCSVTKQTCPGESLTMNTS